MRSNPVQNRNGHNEILVGEALKPIHDEVVILTVQFVLNSLIE